MGEVVNIAFLTLQWAETHCDSGIAATHAVLANSQDALDTGRCETVEFRGIAHAVQVHELLAPCTPDHV